MLFACVCCFTRYWVFLLEIVLQAVLHWCRERGFTPAVAVPASSSLLCLESPWLTGGPEHVDDDDAYIGVYSSSCGAPSDVASASVADPRQVLEQLSAQGLDLRAVDGDK
jgi:hypothetical protein